MVDARWPALPLLVLRGVQLVFAIICLGLSGFIIGEYPLLIIWSTNLTLATGVLTMVYVVINFVLFFINLLLPLPIVIVDAFLLVLWLISMAGLGDAASQFQFFAYSCSEFFLSVDQTDCGIFKADFSLALLQFILFIATLVIASISLHKNRKDLRGAKYNSGLTPDGELIDMEDQGAAGPVQVHEPVYYEENKPVEYQQHQQQQQQQYPQQQQQPNDGYYHQQQQAHSIVSPPQTPAPYNQPQGYASPSPPPPPPPPPVNAQEMPAAYH